MSLTNLFETDLNALTGSAGIVTVEENGRKLICELVEVTPLACRFEQLILKSDELATADVARLKAISDKLSAALTYLLEPLGPVEIDPHQCVVQMRSVPPAKDDDGASYYELLVRRGGQLLLCRYQKQSGAPRQIIPSAVTREVLLRLVGDFAAALD